MSFQRGPTQLREYEHGLTESYAEIEHEAPAKHLFVGTSISNSLFDKRSFALLLKSSLVRLTPSIGLIGILEGCVESGGVGLSLIISLHSRRWEIAGRRR